MTTYELLGRQAEKIAQLEESLGAALGVLRAVKAGTLDLSRLIVREDGGITVEPAPAPTSNGTVPKVLTEAA